MSNIINGSLVSIIIPAYNTGDTITDCLSSIIDQLYTNWELIIVDDGSDDNTLEICNDYAKADSRIKVFENEHSGVSAARNKGLELAKGEFIAFVDSDDYLPNNSILKRVSAIGDADIVIGLYATLRDNIVINMSSGDIREHCSREEALRNTIVAGAYGYQGYVWNKLFRKSLIDTYGIRFAEDVAYNEDRLFCVEYIMHSDRIIICKDNIYVYRYNPSGAMAATARIDSKNSERLLSELLAFDRMLEILKNDITCYYLTIANAHMRTIQLKSAVPKDEQNIHRVLDLKMLNYAIRILSAPNTIVSYKRKIKMLLHALLKI